MKIAVCLAQRGVNCTEVVESMARAQCLSPLHSFKTFPIDAGAVAAGAAGCGAAFTGLAVAAPDFL